MKIGLLEAEISQVLRYTVHDCSVKAVIFQNGGQTVTFRTKEYRESNKDLPLRRTLHQTGSKSAYYMLRCDSFYITQYMIDQSKRSFFKMAAKRLPLGQKSIGSQIKTFLLGVHFTKPNQIRCTRS